MSKIMVMIDQDWRYVYTGGGGLKRWPATTTTKGKSMDYKPSKIRELAEIYPHLKFKESEK